MAKAEAEAGHSFIMSIDLLTFLWLLGGNIYKDYCFAIVFLLYFCQLPLIKSHKIVCEETTMISIGNIYSEIFT